MVYQLTMTLRYGTISTGFGDFEFIDLIDSFENGAECNMFCDVSWWCQ